MEMVMRSGKLMSQKAPRLPFDRSLIFACMLLLLISIVLISSASVQEAYTSTGDQYFYLKRQVIFCGVGLVWFFLMVTIPSATWFNLSWYLMAVVGVLLIVVLLVGREINDAKRWLDLGPVNLQPAEFLKLFWILFFSRYTCRQIVKVRYQIRGFLIPMGMMTVVGTLLLLQPDFGSTVVIAAITMGILFVGGAGIIKYLCAALCLALAGGLLILVQPYRLSRVLSFLDPWQDRFDTGYQLTNSLMAFGQGGFWGEGLGHSVHKLGYLPEAHTDFVMAIMGEEFGFFGVSCVIFIEFFIVVKAVLIALRILRQRSQYQGYVAFGVAVMLCVQTVINIGAASGALPTKGLTLPFISYGGSSLVVCMWALALLVRIDYEWRSHKLGNLKYS